MNPGNSSSFQCFFFGGGGVGNIGRLGAWVRDLEVEEGGEGEEGERFFLERRAKAEREREDLLGEF